MIHNGLHCAGQWVTGAVADAFRASLETAVSKQHVEEQLDKIKIFNDNPCPKCGRRPIICNENTCACPRCGIAYKLKKSTK